MSFAGKTHQLQANLAIQGTGTLVVEKSANVEVLGAAQDILTDLVVDTSGWISGTGTLNSRKSLEWKQGTVQDFQAVNAYGTLKFVGMLDKTIKNTTFNLDSDAEAWWYDIGRIVMDTATFRNYGTFHILNNADILKVPDTPDSWFENMAGGVIEKDVAPNAAQPGTMIDVRFRTWGEMYLNASWITFTRGFEQLGATSYTELLGGKITIGGNNAYLITQGLFHGFGTIEGGLWNVAGTVSVGNAAGLTLTITGQYIQQSTATIRFYAASDEDWGFLSVLGDAHLAGSLLIDLQPGYVPVAPFSKSIISADGTIFGTLTPPPGWDICQRENLLDICF